ncbi:MAG: serine hydrolase domain-containing protein [Candidatus Hodarchaeales archaeon]
MNKRIKLFSVIVSIIIILWGITSGILWINLYDDYIQDKTWLSSTPEDQGMDSAELEQLIRNIKQQRIAIDSLLVIRHGFIIIEEYINLEEYVSHTQSNMDNMHSLYSATKSFTSALIGIAIQEGYIDNISLKVVDCFPEKTIENLDTRKKNMTLEHLLTMTTGFEWDEWTDDSASKMLRSANPVEYMLNLPMIYDPGTKLVYCTGASHLLSAIIQKTTGYTTLEFARKYLFKPMGISEVQWTYDQQSIHHGGHGLSLTSRDIAKFGYLYLNNGTWNGKQIVSTDWVNKSTQTYNFFQENNGYGYQWWTLPQSNIYYASGLYGQRIYVAPENDMVVVFTANILNDLLLDDLFNSILSSVN